MLDFIYVRDPKNKYRGRDVGAHLAVPFIQKAVHNAPNNAALLAHHFRALEIAKQSGTLDDLFRHGPGDQEQQQFLHSRRGTKAYDLLEGSYLFAHMNHLLSQSAQDGTFDNTLSDFDESLCGLYGLFDSYHKLAGAFRQFDKKGLAALMRREKRALTIPELDNYMCKKSGINAKPDFSQLDFLIGYDSSKVENNRRYGIFRQIQPKATSLARAKLGRVYAPREAFQDAVESKVGNFTPIYIVKEKRALPYFLRRHFVEHLKLRPDIMAYFASTRQ